MVVRRMESTHRENRLPRDGEVPLRRRWRAMSQDGLDSAVETNNPQLSVSEPNKSLFLTIHDVSITGQQETFCTA